MYHSILLKTGQQRELTFCHLFMLLLNRSKATVVAVQQPLVECTAIFTMCTVYYRKLPTYLCCDNTQNLHRSSVKQITKQCLHSRLKVNMMAEIKYMILANRRRSDIFMSAKCRTKVFELPDLWLRTRPVVKSVCSWRLETVPWHTTCTIRFHKKSNVCMQRTDLPSLNTVQTGGRDSLQLSAEKTLRNSIMKQLVLVMLSQWEQWNFKAQRRDIKNL